MLAIVAASENGKFNQVIASALASRFKSATVATSSSVFKPEFVADGLFTQVFNGSTGVFNNLELARSLDAVLLARQTVQYGNNASLGTITATMQLEVQVAPIAGTTQNQAWSFTASGAGFSQAQARSNAEDRLVKQIAKDTKMSF